MGQSNTIATNRKARYDYEILETVEAGLVLTGTEIKAVRERRVNLSDAYCRPDSGELWMVNAHIAQFSSGNINNHDPTRPRKLLLHKDQILRLSRQISERRLTVVPLTMYLRRHVAKVELGLAKGRRHYDKRRLLVEKYRAREVQEAVGR
jgi:SsrA-binding protein